MNPGSTHKVRVLCYYLSDYVYSVSDERDLVNEKYFNMSQLVVGQLVTGTVAAINDGQIQLRVGRVNGMDIYFSGTNCAPQSRSRRNFKI